MAVILIAEDNKSTQMLTAAELKQKFEILTADDGEQAWNILLEKHVDTVVADIMMPHLDGYALLKKMRSNGMDIPVILLTAKQSFEDKREGFDAGTDDYMTKPVNYEELVLRINALLRRAKISSERRITAGNLLIDAALSRVTYCGKDITLTRKEFDLLYTFFSYPGKIFTKNELLEEVWGMDSDCTEDTIKTHINRLRNKLADCTEFELVTIKGFGYKAELGKQEKNK